MAEDLKEPAIAEDSESEVLDFTLGVPVEAKADDLTSDKAITAEQQAEAKSIAEATRQKLAAQPKVRIKIAKEKGQQTVVINMARYTIAAGVPVEVPLRVAEILRESGRI